MCYKTEWLSPLGPMTLACNHQALLGAWFVGQKYYGGGHAVHTMQPTPTHPLLLQAVAWLSAYFAGQHPSGNTLPLAPVGTAFRQAVWVILLQIPAGQVRNYGSIAKELATERGLAQMAAQAVGGAVGHNPLAIFIPCHRVVGARGQLTGYAGGLERKQALLALDATANTLAP